MSIKHGWISRIIIKSVYVKGQMLQIALQENKHRELKLSLLPETCLKLKRSHRNSPPSPLLKFPPPILSFSPSRVPLPTWVFITFHHPLSPSSRIQLSSKSLPLTTKSVLSLYQYCFCLDCYHLLKK